MTLEINTHSIDSSIMGFLSTQRTNFLSSTSITNKYLEMTPKICFCITCSQFSDAPIVFVTRLTEPKYPADLLLTWPSALAVTNRLPSGEKRTQLTNLLCSYSRLLRNEKIRGEIYPEKNVLSSCFGRKQEFLSVLLDSSDKILKHSDPDLL